MMVVYEILSGLCVLLSFLCTVLTGNLAFKDVEGKTKSKLKKIFKMKPLRAGLFMISLSEFVVALAVTYLFVPPVDDWFVFVRLTFISIMFTIVSGLILWISLSLETGKIKVVDQEEE